MQFKPQITGIGILLLFFTGTLSGQSFVFKALKIEGNTRTKEAVFLREMDDALGTVLPNPDSVSLVWQKRFTGLGLFNYVSVIAASDTIFIEVKERIYFWAKPFLQWADRNFNVWWQTRDPQRLIYGGTLFLNNIRGLNEQAYVTVISGYNHYYEAGYNTPFKKHKNGWGFSGKAYYWSNHELWYAAAQDKLQFLNKNDGQIQKNAGAEISQKYRIKYFSRLEFTQGWSFIEIDSTAYEANKNYLFSGKKQNEYFLKTEYILDHRDQRDYPTQGYLLKLGLKFSQFAALEDHQVAQAWLRCSGFQPVWKSKGTVLAAGVVANVLSQRVPYRLARQLGYQNDYTRGYEPYVGDGQGFVLGRLGLRQPLVRQKTMVMRFPGAIKNYGHIPISFWLNIFADAGRVIKPWDAISNPLSAGWQRGVGAGIDAMAWYTAMMRFEYSINHLGKGVFNVSFKNVF